MAENNQNLGSALGTDISFKMPKNPKQAFEKQAELAPKVAEAESDVKRAELNLESDILSSKATAAEESATKIREKITDTRDKELLLPRPEFHPTKENAESLGQLFSMVSTFGLLLGNSGKLSAQNAMGAMTGMLKGWEEGRADLYERELKEFEKNYQRIKDMREDLRKDLEDYYKLAPIDREAAQLRLETIARKAGTNSVIGAYARKGDVNSIVKLYENAGNFLQKEEELRLRRSETVKANQNSYQYFQGADGNVVAVNTKNPSDIRVLPKEVSDMLKGAGKLGAPVKPPGLPKKGQTQAEAIGNIIGRPIDVEAAGKIASTWDFTRKLNELRIKSKELGNVPGITVQFADNMDRFLKGKAKDSTDGKLSIDEMREATIDFENDRSFKSLSDKSKIMAKAELDTIMSYLQQKYGNRAPVAEFKAAQTAISRKNMSPEAYEGVIKNEINSAYGRLTQSGIAPNEYKKVVDEFNKTSMSFEELLSDKPAINQSNASSEPKTDGPKEGDESKSKSGKPIVFRDGSWHYKDES